MFYLQVTLDCKHDMAKNYLKDFEPFLAEDTSFPKMQVIQLIIIVLKIKFLYLNLNVFSMNWHCQISYRRSVVSSGHSGIHHQIKTWPLWKSPKLALRHQQSINQYELTFFLNLKLTAHISDALKWFFTLVSN